jgi:hypothetical protein
VFLQLVLVLALLAQQLVELALLELLALLVLVLALLAQQLVELAQQVPELALPLGLLLAVVLVFDRPLNISPPLLLDCSKIIIANNMRRKQEDYLHFSLCWSFASFFYIIKADSIASKQ